MRKKNKIKIKINGKIITTFSTILLKDLIIKYNIPINKVAIELNKKIIDKKKINKIKLNNNDKIEIVHFIGGG
tara:strand:+ start:78 stop:296 length:219 start_codon:yes stop_codon:yes gene_type:complete